MNCIVCIEYFAWTAIMMQLIIWTICNICNLRTVWRFWYLPNIQNFKGVKLIPYANTMSHVRTYNYQISFQQATRNRNKTKQKKSKQNDNLQRNENVFVLSFLPVQCCIPFSVHMVSHNICIIIRPNDFLIYAKYKVCRQTKNWC